MSFEREVIKRLFENTKRLNKNEPNQPLDEKTYTVGNTQYWKRGGKCYSWTSDGGRKECTDDEYIKAISGGNGTPVKNTDPNNDKAKDTTTKSTTTSSASSDNGNAVIDMNGRKYNATVDGMTPDEVVDKYNKIAKHSPGRAIQWIKNNGNLSKVEATKSPIKITRNGNSVNVKLGPGVDYNINAKGLSDDQILDKVENLAKDSKIPWDRNTAVIKDKVDKEPNVKNDTPASSEKPKKVNYSRMSKKSLQKELDKLEQQELYINMKDRMDQDDKDYVKKLKTDIDTVKDLLAKKKNK